jgi:uncharacterized OB-fold protein
VSAGAGTGSGTGTGSGSGSGERPFRILPRLTVDTEFFWTSGADGRLRFLRCTTCGYYVHPPAPICPHCLTKTLQPSVVSGRATVATFTINVQAWIPGFDPPYVVAIVEIEEQPSVRLTTNIVGCAPDDVFIGMPVQVTFEQYDDVWLPLFASAAAPGAVSGGAVSGGAVSGG